jgi:cytosine/adenosine deaminase-related metal-dependent hydrolase
LSTPTPTHRSTHSRFADLDHARDVYTRAVKAHLKHGTTTVSYFATIHKEACDVLVDICRELGQRAFVGKVLKHLSRPPVACLLDGL